ncbi:unnamed protein product, partial [Strongylus vulgaris]
LHPRKTAPTHSRAEDSASSEPEKKTVNIWFYEYDIPEIVIKYRNTEELREELHRKLKGMKFSFAEVHQPDMGYRIATVKNADDLFAMMETDPGSVSHLKLWYVPHDEQDTKNRKKPVDLSNKLRSRSPSPIRRRHCSGINHVVDNAHIHLTAMPHVSQPASTPGILG